MTGRQKGSVIIVTLWTITLLTILITVIASQNRLTARAAFYHQEDLSIWANVLAAVNQAEMELIMENMARPSETIEDLDEINRNPRYRFNGQELELNYPVAEGISVRIYDHAGKINLREISRPRMRALLEKKLGEDQDERIDELIAAWGDWLDLNEGEGVNGAEREYYEGLDIPYSPRNGKLETVEELLEIRGWDEVFGDIDMEAAFTLYTDDTQINLNLATVETMRLLPGLDDELIVRILDWRRQNEFTGNGDVAQLVPEESMVELRPWLNSRKTSFFFTVMAYPRQEGQAFADELDVDEDFLQDQSSAAFAEIVEVSSASERAKILKVDPYEKIPIRPVFVDENE